MYEGLNVEQEAKQRIDEVSGHSYIDRMFIALSRLVAEHRVLKGPRPYRMEFGVDGVCYGMEFQTFEEMQQWKRLCSSKSVVHDPVNPMEGQEMT